MNVSAQSRIENLARLSAEYDEAAEAYVAHERMYGPRLDLPLSLREERDALMRDAEATYGSYAETLYRTQ